MPMGLSLLEDGLISAGKFAPKSSRRNSRSFLMFYGFAPQQPREKQNAEGTPVRDVSKEPGVEP